MRVITRLESDVAEAQRRLALGRGHDTATVTEHDIALLGDGDEVVVAFRADDAARTPQSDPYWQAEIYVAGRRLGAAILEMLDALHDAGHGGEIINWTPENVAGERAMDRFKREGKIVWVASTRAGGPQEVVIDVARAGLQTLGTS